MGENEQRRNDAFYVPHARIHIQKHSFGIGKRAAHSHTHTRAHRRKLATKLGRWLDLCTRRATYTCVSQLQKQKYLCSTSNRAGTRKKTIFRDFSLVLAVTVVWSQCVYAPASSLAAFDKIVKSDFRVRAQFRFRFLFWIFSSGK